MMIYPIAAERVLARDLRARTQTVAAMLAENLAPLAK